MVQVFGWLCHDSGVSGAPFHKDLVVLATLHFEFHRSVSAILFVYARDTRCSHRAFCESVTTTFGELIDGPVTPSVLNVEKSIDYRSDFAG